MRITGWVLSILVSLFMLVDGFGHTMQFAPYVKGTVDVGYPASVVMPIGIVELAIAILYVIPQTNILGAILLTAYFGGATATHVRVSQPFYLPIVFGVVTWLGLWLRDGELRRLTPFRTTEIR
ncbi:MAG TPA: DoxX family protein [Thermoanaerobaculia bacterium]